MLRRSADARAARLRRYWDKQAPRYDKQVAFFERWLLGDGRQWVSSQATGDVLEVAIGTGRNLPFSRVPQFVATWSWLGGAFRWSGTQGMRLEALRTRECSNTTGRGELDLPAVLWFVCGHVPAVHAARQHRRHRRALRRAGPQPAGGRQGQAGCADEPGPGRPAGHRRGLPAGGPPPPTPSGRRRPPR